MRWIRRADSDRGALADEHYARLYRELEPVGMAVEEHTAQWKSSKASALQDDFVRARINVLSCSTTFELGVDVGDVQAVLLRNVPPTPANYVQRAGRAGRRTDSAALVVTYAQRRSHDLTYFNSPHDMVDGMIPPPRIVLDNAPIVRRHLHSLAFGAFQREFGDHRTVEDFFLAPDGVEDARVGEFVTWLRSRPKPLGEAALRVVPDALHGPLRLADWGGSTRSSDQRTRTRHMAGLTRARAEIAEDVAALQDLVDEAAEDEKFGRAAQLKRLRVALIRRQLLSFLGSRKRPGRSMASPSTSSSSTSPVQVTRLPAISSSRAISRLRSATTYPAQSPSPARSFGAASGSFAGPTGNGRNTNGSAARSATPSGTAWLRPR